MEVHIKVYGRALIDEKHGCPRRHHTRIERDPRSFVRLLLKNISEIDDKIGEDEIFRITTSNYITRPLKSLKTSIIPRTSTPWKRSPSNPNEALI